MNKEQIMDSLEKFQSNHANPDLRLYGYVYESWKKEADLSKLKGFCSEPWVIGGRSGGNYENEANRDSSIEDPKEIDLLDDYLEEYFPNITVIRYKRLMRLVQYQNWTENEYYGNTSDYKCAFITFEDIAEYLSNLNKP